MRATTKRARSVARQNEDRPLGVKTAVEQGLPDRTRSVPPLAVGDRPPAIAGTLREHDIGRRSLRPELQGLGHAAWIGTEIARVAHDQAAVIGGFKNRFDRRHWGRLDAALGHHSAPLAACFAARSRKNVSSRALASSSTMVRAAIRLSVK
jgi:hypothetical protein